MRKTTVLVILVVLLAVIGSFAPRVYADWLAAATILPSRIPPGESVNIAICNIGDDALEVCDWRVIRPDGTWDQITPAGEIINPGECWNYTYPYDFNGNTNQTGKYTVSLWVDDPLCKNPQEMLMPPEFNEPAWFIVGSPCFVATAAYGTSTAEELDTLRAFRDEVLLQNSIGSSLVALYYDVSPPLADFISEHGVLRTFVRDFFVEPLVWLVEATQAIWRN